MLYTNDDVQILIDQTNKDPKLKGLIRSQLSGRDLLALNDVLSDGTCERFDRYDSDVCEQFISAYENSVKQLRS